MQLKMVGSINRNIVECKVTLNHCDLLSGCVLIETLWNVKSVGVSSMVITASINRNIVECKVGYGRVDGW